LGCPECSLRWPQCGRKRRAKHDSFCVRQPGNSLVSQKQSDDELVNLKKFLEKKRMLDSNGNYGDGLKKKTVVQKKSGEET
jgi:hypothetical protein